MHLRFRSVFGLLLWVVCLLTFAVALHMSPWDISVARRAILSIGSFLGAALSAVLVVTSHKRANFWVPGAVIVLLVTGLFTFFAGASLFLLTIPEQPESLFSVWRYLPLWLLEQ